MQGVQCWVKGEGLGEEESVHQFVEIVLTSTVMFEVSRILRRSWRCVSFEYEKLLRSGGEGD